MGLLTVKSRPAGLFWMALGFVSSLGAKPGIEVQSDEVRHGQYTFTLNASDFEKNIFLDEMVFASVNLQMRSTGSGEGRRYFFRASPGEKRAELIVKIDFGKTSFRPKTVAISDNLFLFDSINGAASQDVTARTEWSLDGNAWLKIRSASTAGVADNRSSSGIKFINLAGHPEVFYYRVTFDSALGGFISDQNQWARGSESGTLFELEFD